MDSRHAESTTHSDSLFARPKNRMRLVMPPALGMILAYPIWTLYEAILPLGIGPGVISGAMMGFVLYDMIHCKSSLESLFFRLKYPF
jgi:hypothetical protein